MPDSPLACDGRLGRLIPSLSALPLLAMALVPGAVATPRRDEVGESSASEDSAPRVVNRPPDTASAHAGGIVLGDTIEAGFVDVAVEEGLAVEVIELTSPPNF